jgi:hypothetical protein
MVIYVDDCCTIGTDTVIDKVIASLKIYGFGLKVNSIGYLCYTIVQYID